jgi:maltose alpha-D-glucosyltransferase/alpha-amylase
VLPSLRWFAGKARVIVSVAPVDYAGVPGTTGALALFRVRYADGHEETYHAPLLSGGRGAGWRDALDDAAFSTALVTQIRAEAALRGTQGTFRFSSTTALAQILRGPIREATRIGAEQSNTSVAYDGAAILKCFRRIEPGPNPELEITEFFTRQTAFRGVPRLAGAIAYQVPGEPPSTLAVLQEFVANQGDAWTWTGARLDEHLGAAGGGVAAEPDAAFARALAAADAREARRLGEITGQLHMALGRAPAGSPLAPEPLDAGTLAAWAAAMQDDLGRTLASLESALARLPAPDRELAQRVLDAAPGLRHALGAIDALGREPVTRIRLHGDYHLGQVLRAADGFVILDFEGEPTRPLEARRATGCALKDVAGMLRSYAYAAQAALRRAADAAADDPQRRARLVPWTEAWEEGVRTAFLDGYLGETRNRGATFLPRAPEVLEEALRAYEVDKAIYELRYELAHRPAWVGIPLGGLERALGRNPRAPAGRLRPGEGPFRFVACLELREFVGVRAENERQLAQLIEEVPLDSIYYHTHGFFLRHKFVAGPYPNDFATWAALEVRDRALGERLAMVDPADVAGLEALRDELVAVIDEHLRDLPIVPRVVTGEPFDFIQSRTVEIPIEVDLSALYFHLVEARMRLGRGQNDFAAWLERGLGLPRLAARVRVVDPYAGSLEQTRARLIDLCDQALADGPA